MGNVITASGLKPDPAKIDAIVNMPASSDEKGAERLVGMVNYLARFMPNLSTVIEPIRKLKCNDVPFIWAQEQENAFDEIKRIITSGPVLKYFDAKSQNLVLQCDSSRSGLGAVLLQNTQPIGYGSRSLTSAEQNYAQIELELLAVIYGLEHFHQITYGRPVEVHSDHKPLEVIAKRPLIEAPKRLQRMLLRLRAYDATIVYKKGTELYIADTLSRASPKTTSGPSADHNMHIFKAELESINLADSLPMPEEKIRKLQTLTAKDETLCQLKTLISEGWPDRKQIPKQLTPFYHVKDLLTVQNGIIFKNDQCVIPRAMRKEIMQEIHLPHLGEEYTLRAARQYAYWPLMSSEIKDMVSKCDACQTHKDSQQKETLISHEIPDRPFQFISADLMTINNQDYLITVDHYSNFWEIDRLYNTTSKSVIHKLKMHFSRNGICDEITTDNGPQFASEEFRKFSKEWSLEHKLTSPRHPQSNGRAELAVKSAKNILKKATQTKQDVYLAILHHRNTPNSQGTSPAQRLMGRRTKTTLPTKASLLQPQIINPENEKTKMKAVRAKQQFYYNRNAKDLSELNIGENIDLEKKLDPTKNEWKQGTISNRVKQRSYEVDIQGSSYRRNRVHIRKSNMKRTDESTDEIPPLSPLLSPLK